MHNLAESALEPKADLTRGKIDFRNVQQRTFDEISKSAGHSIWLPLLGHTNRVVNGLQKKPSVEWAYIVLLSPQPRWPWLQNQAFSGEEPPNIKPETTITGMSGLFFSMPFVVSMQIPIASDCFGG
jgi:hypothetical protein